MQQNLAVFSGKETGASKWNEAKKRGTKLLVEDGLLDMVRASEPFVEHDAAVEPMADVQVISDTGTASGARKSAGSTKSPSKIAAQAPSTKKAASVDPGVDLSMS